MRAQRRCLRALSSSSCHAAAGFPKAFSLSWAPMSSCRSARVQDSSWQSSISDMRRRCASNLRLHSDLRFHDGAATAPIFLPMQEPKGRRSARMLPEAAASDPYASRPRSSPPGTYCRSFAGCRRGRMRQQLLPRLRRPRAARAEGRRGGSCPEGRAPQSRKGRGTDEDEPSQMPAGEGGQAVEDRLSCLRRASKDGGRLQ